MPDMEKRLRSELNYRPVSDVWFTAFDVDLAKSKITSSEREFIDNFVRWQLAAARASTDGSKAGENRQKTTQQPAQ
jgi:hypothetical protein